MEKLSYKINDKEVMPKQRPLLSIIKKLQVPDNLSEIRLINTDSLKLDILARLKCQNCGLY